MDRKKDTEATAEVDDLLRSVGLGHGRRTTLAGSWHERAASETETAGRSQETEIGAWNDSKAFNGYMRSRLAESRMAASWLQHARGWRLDHIRSGSLAYRSLNLGWTQQDESANVAENRRRFLAKVAGQR